MHVMTHLIHLRPAYHLLKEWVQVLIDAGHQACLTVSMLGSPNPEP